MADVALPALPADIGDWVPMVDPDSRAVYWYNKVTGESSWEVPAAAEATTTAIGTVHAEAQSKSDSDALTSTAPPADGCDSLLASVVPTAIQVPLARWVSILDEGSGCYYWYNEVNGESTWDDPNAPAAALAPPASSHTTPAPEPSSSWGSPGTFAAVELSWNNVSTLKPTARKNLITWASQSSLTSSSAARAAPLQPPSSLAAYLTAFGSSGDTDASAVTGHQQELKASQFVTQLVACALTLIPCQGDGCTVQVPAAVSHPIYCYKHQYLHCFQS